jgi:hypothetical protein
MDTAKVPVTEHGERVKWSPEQCVIDRKTFYIRGRIPVPVHGMDEPFIWGVWVELSPKTFLRVDEMWNVEGRESEPVFTGYLNSEIAVYTPTYNLEVDVKTRPIGERPQFFVQDKEHPLAVEQRDGISIERVQEIAEMMMHPNQKEVRVDEVAFLRRLYEQFNARETDGLLAQMAPDVMWANAMEGGHAQGRDAVLAYWTRQWSMFDPQVEPEEFSHGDDGAVTVKVHQVVKDLEGKVLADVRVGHVFRLEGGLVKQFDVSENWAH